jgi:AraC-like DNA-binding protein
MKPLLFRNPKTEKESFYVQEDRLPRFYDVLHYHPEIQLTVILEGSGTRFVGDNISHFEAGDVVLLGTNLPHVSRNDAMYYEENSGLMAHALSVYFKQEAFGREFFELPEATAIRELLVKSSRGLKITGKAREKVYPLIVDMKMLHGFDRLMNLLAILNIVARSNDTEYISSISYTSPQKDSDSKKINDVFDFVMSHFHEKIKLEEVAEIAFMSPTAFCRYFKLRTRKTFSQFLNEVRIGNACKLLIDGKYNVTEVSYFCGFNNISNFNRQFKTIMEMTPSEYTNRFREGVDR